MNWFYAMCNLDNLNFSISVVLKTFVLIIFTYIAVKIVLFWLDVNRIKTSFKDAPGPKKYHWLFGHLYYFPESGHERIQHFINIANDYGDKGYVFLWAPFRFPMIIATSPKVMAMICKSSEPKLLNLIGPYRLILPWLGEGLLTANGSKWARNRRLLTPAFHFDILKPYLKVYNDCADTLIKKWSHSVEKGERFEVFGSCCLCTLDVILRCAFSYSKDIQNAGDSNSYVQAVNRLVQSLFIRFTRPWLMFDSIFRLTSYGRQFKRDCDLVHSVAEEVISKRQKALDSEGINENKKHLDFLDILLRARDDKGEGLTPIEIRNEVDTFLFEGHDTTGSSLSWILHSLAENPDCQMKCQEEIDRVLQGKNTEDIEWEDLPKLEYLTMCIKEGMRMHAPVPMVSRQTTKEFTIDDRIIPPGTVFQINILVMSHMESIWGKNHMDFVPERFSKDNISQMDPFQYVPFSAGQRNCIGQNFAMNEEKVILAKILRNFTFWSDPDHKVKKSLTAVVRAPDGIYLYAKKRLISKG